MKRLFSLLCAVVAFAACEQAPIEEQSAIRHEAPDTITVGFEGDDTRIQLNEAQKTVWTEGDQVSVFYKSYDNLKFEFEGNTGDRDGTLKRVGGQHNGQTMDDVVVVYPYSADYMITLSEGCVNATIPSTQTYLKGSYGVGDNLMIARSSFNQFSLKSVCGWLKIQLTGDGEVIERITFRGNSGEQVAGLVYVDATTAEATLATAKHNSDDNSQLDGTLVLDDSIYTEVTLDCGEGVALGKNTTAFYIALPPQTFEKGFTVVIEDTEGYVMEQSTDKALTIERNTIQPMAAFEFINPATPSAPAPASNEIWYTSSDGKVVTPQYTYVFGANITSNEYNNDMGIITFDGDVTTIGDSAFFHCDSLTSVNIPDSVTEIGEDAFYKCTRLTSVTIGDSVTTIGEWAFCGCTSLTEFTGKFAEDNGRILVVDGVLAAFAPAGITEYNIPDSVTTIGEWAFYSCTSLTSVNIPDSVTTIGNYAFSSCDSLTSVNIPDSVTTIGQDAFSGCDSLTSVYCYATVPPSLGSRVFEYNASARRIYVYEECVEVYKSAWSDYKDSIYTNGENCPETTTIEYTTNDGNTITPSNLPIISNIYENGVGTMVVVGKIALIPNDAFENCDSLTSVNIPDSVTTIGSSAFSSCDSLTSVTIGDSVTTIGDHAFIYCRSLTSVTIGDSVTTIGNSAFYDCRSLTSVNIPDSVTEIGEYAFNDCDSLTSLNIPDSVTEIGDNAFEDCTSLTSVTIGNSVTEIGSSAFEYCTSLTSVNIPDSVTTIGYEAFHNCYSLTSVNIGDSVTTIGYEAFSWCSSLTSVNIGDSVTTIESSAFYRCTSLTSVTIPDSVTTIEYEAFRHCYSLTSVYCKATTPPALGESTVFYDNGSGRKIYVPAGSVNAYKSAANWSQYADAIVGYDFENGEIEEVQPNNEIWYTSSNGQVVTPFLTNVFGANIISNEYNNGMGVITFDGDVTSIGNYAFNDRTRLTSVNIPDSVTWIGDCAFWGCDRLTSVYCYATIPPSLGDAFYNNASGQQIYVYEECVELYKSAWSSYKDSIFTNGKNCPETTTIQYTTNDGNTITSSNLPIISNIYENGVGTLVYSGKQIPHYAFEDYTSLTSVNIPDSVTKIGYAAFSGCTSLKEFKGKFATEDGRSLIMDNTIIAYAYASGNTYNIPDSVTEIGYMAFDWCGSLTSVNIPDSVTTIGDIAFRNCSLTSVNIPDSVTTIGVVAFRFCDSLTRVTIGDSVTEIGWGVFDGCTSLTSVYCKATTPPSLGDYTVFDNNGSGRKIYVPAGSVNAYKNAEYWSNYADAIVGYNF